MAAAGMLALLSVLVALIVPPTDELPHCDDWDYVETARHFLSTGRLVLSDWPAFTLIAHVLWGALFGAVLGPTYFAFRVSMYVMSWLGAVGLYEWGRRSGRGWRESVWIAALIPLNPLNMVYQNSFMSDVTAVSAFIALLVLLLPIVRGPAHSVGTGLVSAFGYLARQTAIVPLIADCLLALPGIVLRHRVDRRLLIVLVTFLPFVIAHWCWLQWSGVPYSQQLSAKTIIPGGEELLQRMTILLLGTCLSSAPFTLGWWSQRQFRCTRRGIVLGTLLLGLVIGLNRGLPEPYARQEVFDLGTGFSDSIVEMQNLEGPAVTIGSHRFSIFRVVATLIALVSGLALSQMVATGESRQRFRGNRGLQLAGLSTAILVGLLLLAPTMHGRYVWPVVVASLMTLLMVVSPLERDVSPRLGAALMLVYAAFGVLGLQDNSVCQRTVWQAIRQLEAQGIDPLQINAGLEYGGLRRFTPRYRGPENRGPYLGTLSPHQRDVEFVLYNPHNIFAPARDYSVTYGPLAGWEVMNRLPFESWWRRGEIYILKRQ